MNNHQNGKALFIENAICDILLLELIRNKVF